MNEESFQVGRIVQSKAGRDKDGCFLICEVVDEQYVLLVDGDLRTMNKPKKKKRKHLHPTSVINQSIAEALIKHQRVFDHEIRQALIEAKQIKEDQIFSRVHKRREQLV